jgi:hypothetical protein
MDGIGSVYLGGNRAIANAALFEGVSKLANEASNQIGC